MRKDRSALWLRILLDIELSTQRVALDETVDFLCTEDRNDPRKCCAFAPRSAVLGVVPVLAPSCEFCEHHLGSRGGSLA